MATVTPAVRPTWTDLTRRGLATAAVAAVANALLLTLVLETGLVEPFAPLSYPPVVLFSAGGAVGATLVYGLFTGRVADADRTFVRVAGAVLVASFLPDIGLLYADPGATVPGVVVLMVMHVVVAAVCVASLTELGWGVPKGTRPDATEE
ncbi:MULTISPECIES: DUF6069 family protein [Haloferax]|uniref:Uncharacterized protein n=1 Tax=Haloferax massiliensis TaxID=1476858 RepID=A0A0D6JTQ1_9EURY|nr:MULTISPECIES: DUF6069 family protein [Haloferax]MDS0242033.1 DUF6069 family protein [Haloferax sp. S2CR25]MDS0445154.1 DUF6069 family protein [Haloferax sp. S2CR25-2]CQR50998.1 hypothetical protein BN996_02484 [Haloferax massiliensis]